MAHTGRPEDTTWDIHYTQAFTEAVLGMDYRQQVRVWGVLHEWLDQTRSGKMRSFDEFGVAYAHIGSQREAGLRAVRILASVQQHGFLAWLGGKNGIVNRRYLFVFHVEETDEEP